MNKNLLLGLWRLMLPIPPAVWRKSEKGASHGLDFMTKAHHQVRDFAVLELPRYGKPLSPQYIAQSLQLPLPQVVQILDQLESHKTFLFRNPAGEVTWAYPITVDPTPHRLTFSTGEQVYAAWGVDAIATPFVQGQLRNEKLSVLIHTECAHCRQPIEIEVDSDLNCRLLSDGASPLFYAPMLAIQKLEPSIIDGFWRKSVFFWSEEHAKDYRRRYGGERGAYITLAQSRHFIVASQSALFNFPRSA